MNMTGGTGMKTFDGKQTEWEGLWWHPEYNGYSSALISFSSLREFKGAVRLYVRKNKFFNAGENGRPNYCFCFKAKDADVFDQLKVIDEKACPYKDGDNYYTEDGERLYTREETRKIINGTVKDVEYGFRDPYDILPEDFV
jgi:hypothetical protein